MGSDDALSQDVWRLMSDLVLDQLRRREVSEAVGMSFGRARAVRHVAQRPMSMGELADALDIDRPNASALVTDLEAQGVLRRRPHPGDGRAKLVEATRKGQALARRADEILSRPPAPLRELAAEDLKALHGILSGMAATRPAR